MATLHSRAAKIAIFHQCNFPFFPFFFGCGASLGKTLILPQMMKLTSGATSIRLREGRGRKGKEDMEDKKVIFFPYF